MDGAEELCGPDLRLYVVGTVLRSPGTVGKYQQHTVDDEELSAVESHVQSGWLAVKKMCAA